MKAVCSSPTLSYFCVVGRPWKVAVIISMSFFLLFCTVRTQNKKMKREGGKVKKARKETIWRRWRIPRGKKINAKPIKVLFRAIRNKIVNINYLNCFFHIIFTYQLFMMRQNIFHGNQTRKIPLLSWRSIGVTNMNILLLIDLWRSECGIWFIY